MRVSLLLVLVPLLVLLTPLESKAAPGDPDPSFGVGGVATFDFAQNYDNVYAVGVQPDGKIVVVGTVMTAARNADILVLRYTPAGALDPSFGSGGVVTTSLAPGSSDEAHAMLLQPDGKIVVGGYSSAAAPDNGFVLLRYNANGSLDASFGVGGIVTTDPPGRDNVIDGIALQPDGSIVAVGRTCICTENSWDMVVARYTSAGALDASFGAGGIVITDFTSSDDEALDVAIQNDGRILVGGYTNSADGTGNIALVRYLANGSLDATFGDGGLLAKDVAGSYDRFCDLVLQPDGKIVVAAGIYVYVNPSRYGSQIGLIRFLTDGSLDPSFGANGVMLDNPSAPNEDNAWAVILQQNGKLVVGGQALARYDNDGASDAAFHLSTYDQNLFIYALAMQPDGKIVAAGIVQGFVADVWVARFEGDGTDTSAPNAAPAQSPPSTPLGWNNTDVTVSWNWTDDEAGVDAANCTSQSTSAGEGEIRLEAACQDLAGNPASTTYEVKVDKTPPQIFAVADMEAEATWYNRDVTVRFTCSDALSGLAGACPPDQLLSKEGTVAASGAYTVIDAAGNVSAPSNVVTANIDKTAPVLGECPAAGPFSYNGGIITAGPIEAHDVLSGLDAGASVLLAPINTNTLGLTTVEFVAADRAGNVTAKLCQYRVAHSFAGFFQPVDNLPVLNVVKGGSAVPVKFSLRGFQGLNIFAPGYPASRQIACDSGAPLAEIEQTVTAGSSSLTYDAASDQYLYVWKTDKSWGATCRQLVVMLADGFSHPANFRFK
jgi:uncharacterized delta-60 repeat protein